MLNKRKIKMCRVTLGVHKKVSSLAEERGLTFGAALELIIERGEDAYSELVARGYRIK